MEGMRIYIYYYVHKHTRCSYATFTHMLGRQPPILFGINWPKIAIYLWANINQLVIRFWLSRKNIPKIERATKWHHITLNCLAEFRYWDIYGFVVCVWVLVGSKHHGKYTLNWSTVYYIVSNAFRLCFLLPNWMNNDLHCALKQINIDWKP